MNARTPEIQDELAFLASQVPLDGARIVELGCGDAAFARKLVGRHRDAHVTGLEVDDLALADNLARGGERLAFVRAGAQSIPFDDGAFDVAIMLKSLHHVPMPSIGTALEEARRVLKPGGYLYVSEPRYEGSFNDIIRIFNDEKVVRAAAQDALREAIAGGGWDVVLEGRFTSPVVYAGWDDFRKKHLEASYREDVVSDQVAAAVRRAFEPHLQADGAHFERLLQICILRKRRAGG